MAWALVSTRHPSVPRIYKLLLSIYPEIQLDSYTTYLNVKNFKEYWVFDTTWGVRSWGWIW